MPQNEKVLWEILELLCGKTTQMAKGYQNREETVEIENAYPVEQLKGVLVLRYPPQDIDDTIYFMKYRGYIKNHGYGLMLPEVVYSLSEKALEANSTRVLPEDEEQAFREALWDVGTPKLYGMGFNLGELWRRTKKRVKKK